MLAHDVTSRSGTQEAALMFVQRRLCSAILACAITITLAAGPGLAVQAQTGGPCDDLASQIDATNGDLEQLENESLPLLMQAQQLAAIAPADTQVVAAEGLSPLLTPETAGLYGAAAAAVGARIDAWRSANDSAAADAYWRDLAGNASDWYSGLVSITAPIQAFVPSLSGLTSTLLDLQLLATRAQADLALVDSLSQSLQQCQDANPPAPPPPPPSAGGGDDQALCSVGGQPGFSNSQCFGLELDAATAVWAACLDAYFAAEREAFRTGGDLPANTCDGR
jgi:hypothetical protein